MHLGVVVISSPEQTGARPLELLAAVHHRRKVHPNLGVKHHRTHRRAAVDDGEHRRRDNVAESRRPGGLDVEVDRVLDPQGISRTP